MFTATKTHVATYLIVICLFSISLLVFVNASISFVVTTIIGQEEDVGNAVGTLGFADELVALVACPLWGLLSDHVGARPVCILAYIIIGVALLLFVQARDVLPQLLLVRLLFSIGAAGTSTMITAILPMMTAPHEDNSLKKSTSIPGESVNAASIASDVTITPHNQPSSQKQKPAMQPSPMRSAGFVGLFSGCGALLALFLFLRLPEFIQGNGTNAANALKDSYRIVGTVALLLSVLCVFGLRNLHGEAGKGWSALFDTKIEKKQISHRGASLLEAVTLGFRIPSLGLAYIGGLVARASSIGITLFVPLLVNTYFISTGLCDESSRDPIAARKKCRSAYVLAAELTGVSQLVGLVFAPIFGFLADRYQRFNLLLLLAAFSGFLGYLAMITLKSPKFNGDDGSPWIFVIMALLGINQIGAIVCSLGLLGRCVLGLQNDSHSLGESTSNGPYVASGDAGMADGVSTDGGDQESVPLLAKELAPRDLQHLKGSIAGVYSLFGGVGILLLTKVGGVLFDKNAAAPFLILSVFNALLLVAGVLSTLPTRLRRKNAPHS